MRSRIPAIFFCVLLSACGGSGQSAAADPAPVTPADPAPVVLSDLASVGASLFRERSLAASGAMACNTCHNAGQAYAQTNDLSVQLGGAELNIAGTRAVPSLRYMAATPAFHFDASGKPFGGLNHDGRTATLEQQAERPFLAPHEMANASRGEILARLGRAELAEDFRKVFGASIFADAQKAYDSLIAAIVRFERESPDFAPFDSKYDAYLAGKVALNAAEQRGLAIFNDRNKGNCAACHPSAKGSDGSAPLFTDFGYDNLGVPRNTAIPANADPAYFDMGLCGPERTDLAARADLCGYFKTPTLRNVASRQVFFHNGVFKDLRTVLQFYSTRDARPQDWYPRAADGSVVKFNDLPPALRANMNLATPPYGRSSAVLSEAEIDDLLAFLNTLTDGYRIQPTAAN